MEVETSKSLISYCCSFSPFFPSLGSLGLSARSQLIILSPPSLSVAAFALSRSLCGPLHPLNRREKGARFLSCRKRERKHKIKAPFFSLSSLAISPAVSFHSFGVVSVSLSLPIGSLSPFHSLFSYAHSGRISAESVDGESSL